jgi:hypothetical protein
MGAVGPNAITLSNFAATASSSLGIIGALAALAAFAALGAALVRQRSAGRSR